MGDVSAVTNMRGMFNEATEFNQDLSKWDVSAVTNMHQMFYSALAFQQTLCGPAWVNSKARKYYMFWNTLGTICTTTTVDATADTDTTAATTDATDVFAPESMQELTGAVQLLRTCLDNEESVLV